MQIRQATPNDAGPVSALIQALSGPLLASPDGHGAERFLASISTTAIAGAIASARFRFWVVDTGLAPAGVVALRDCNHLYHRFVAQTFQRADAQAGGGRRRLSKTTECGFPSASSVQQP